MGDAREDWYVDDWLEKILGIFCSMTVDERLATLYDSCWDVRISHPSSPEALGISERNAFTSAMRAKWNEKLSALLFPSRVATLLRCYVRILSFFARLSRRIAFALKSN